MASWAPLATGSRSRRSVQLQTEVDPLGAADGVDLRPGLRRVNRLSTYLVAPDGQTFDGTGFARAWFYDTVRAKWLRVPGTDEDLADLVGLAEAALPSMAVGSERGRFAWLLDGVGLSGAGGNITLDMVLTSIDGASV